MSCPRCNPRDSSDVVWKKVSTFERHASGCSSLWGSDTSSGIGLRKPNQSPESATGGVL
jgi:hypothetical protein